MLGVSRIDISIRNGFVLIKTTWILENKNQVAFTEYTQRFFAANFVRIMSKWDLIISRLSIELYLLIGVAVHISQLFAAAKCNLFCHSSQFWRFPWTFSQRNYISNLFIKVVWLAIYVIRHTRFHDKLRFHSMFGNLMNI